MRTIKLIVIFAIMHIVFLLGFKDNLGYLNFDKYKSLRAEVESVEGSFPDLKRHLKRACKFSKNPLFYKELGRINLEMAIAENQFGEAAKRDDYLDQAEENLLQQIKRNPVDSSGYYGLGQVYMLYNYPLMTYMGKGRLYFRKALELDPSDERSNLNILYIFLTQWQYLDNEEKKFTFDKLNRMNQSNEHFIRQLRNRWVENFEDDILLKAILIKDKNIWPLIDKYF
ncbi:hypothetical protein ACFLT2_14235 [Acidobacteriota bacterium]